MRRWPLLLLMALAARAQGRPLRVVSPHLSTPLRCVVFRPQGKEGLPVAVLLHGGGGRATDFQALGAARMAAAHRVILVAVDGGQTGFLDARGEARDGMGRALREDLPRALARRFPAAKARKNRAILGLSLGGFAALYEGVNHPEGYGFAGALSGAVELPQWGPMEVGALPPPIQTLFTRAFGPPDGDGRLRYDLFQHVEGLKLRARRGLPYFYSACGTEDLFLAANQRWADHLLALRIPHEFHQGPGGHDPGYWKAQLEEALRAYARWRSSS